MQPLTRLPNLRDLIIPDTNYTIVDEDLNRADVQVVAWDSNDSALKEKLLAEQRDPAKDLHTQNAFDLFGKTDKKYRDLGKKIVHASNYLVTPRTLAAQTGILVSEGERFIATWFRKHPAIPEWHRRVARQLAETREVRNAFGFRRFFFGRTEDCLPEAVAWVPQSTVALVINHALCNIAENLPDVQLLLQVHDSLTMQIPTHRLEELLPQVAAQSRIVVPYPDPLIIPTSFKMSNKSWGQCK
jgi:DNA polymerase I